MTISTAAPRTTHLLRNPLIAVEVDLVTGGMVRLTDLRTGQEHVHEPTGRLFRITGPHHDLDAGAIDSEHQSAELVHGDEQRLTLRFRSLLARNADGDMVGIDAGVEVEFWVEDGPELFTRMRIHNFSDHPFHQVQFPLVSGWTGYAGPGADLVTTGSLMNSGTVDPHADNINREIDWYTLLGAFERWEIPFPARSDTPWVDLSGGGRGMGIHNYMTVPRVGGVMLRDFSGYDKRHVMELGWYTVVGIEPDTRWESPTFGIHLHHGDWHDTSDHYREWLLTWWRPVLAPEAFKRTLGFQNVIVKDFDGLRYRRFSDLPEIVRAGREFGAEGLCIWEFLMLGFYLRTDPAGLHDYSPEELAELRDAITACQAEGAVVSALTNMRLVLPTATESWERFRDGAMRNTFGEIGLENWAAMSQEAGFWPRGRGPASAVLCPRSEQFRALSDEHLDALTEIGFDAMFVDHPFEYRPCYGDHGHLEPGDTHEAIVDWAVDYRSRFDPRPTGGYIMGEQPDLFTAAGIDVFWNWSWYKARPDITAYCFPELTQTYVVDRSHQDALEGFLHGFQLALCTRGLTGDLRDDPDWAAWIRDLAQLRTATADTTTLARFVDDRGLTVEGTVRAKRFVHDAGTSVVVVNQGKETVTAAVSVDVAGRSAAVHSTPGCSWTEGAGNLAITMPAHSALVWDLAID